MNKEVLTGFLETLSDVIENDKVEMFRSVIGSLQIERYDDPEGFYYGVLFPWSKFIGGFLKSELKANDDIEFIYKNYRFIEAQVRAFVVQHEGLMYSADKSRTIIRRLVSFYSKDEKIVFDYDSEYTYHLPRKVFTTHEDIICFYEAVRGLYYGNPAKYLHEANKLIKK